MFATTGTGGLSCDLGMSARVLGRARMLASFCGLLAVFILSQAAASGGFVRTPELEPWLQQTPWGVHLTDAVLTALNYINLATLLLIFYAALNGRRALLALAPLYLITYAIMASRFVPAPDAGLFHIVTWLSALWFVAWVQVIPFIWFALDYAWAALPRQRAEIILSSPAAPAPHLWGRIQELLGFPRGLRRGLIASLVANTLHVLSIVLHFAGIGLSVMAALTVVYAVGAFLSAAISGMDRSGANLAEGLRLLGETGLYVLGVAAAIFLGRACRRLARYLSRASLAQRIKLDSRAPILFLRSFHDDKARIESRRGFARLLSVEPAPIFLDHVLVENFSRYGPVVAIGKPGEKTLPFGAARIYVEDAIWRDTIEQNAARAAAIIIVADESAGVKWEIARALEDDLSERACFVAPMRRGAADLRDHSVLGPVLVQAGLADGAPVIGLFRRHGQWHALHSANISADALVVALQSFFRFELWSGFTQPGAAPAARRKGVARRWIVGAVQASAAFAVFAFFVALYAPAAIIQRPMQACLTSDAPSAGIEGCTRLIGLSRWLGEAAVADAHGLRARYRLLVQDAAGGVADLTIALEAGEARGARADNAAMSEGYWMRAMALRMLGQPGRAVDDASAAIARAPDLPHGYFLRSQAYDDLGQVSEAVADIDMALARLRRAEFGPDTVAEMYNHACWILAKSGRDLELALRHCASSLELAETAAAYDSRGLVNLKRREFAEALSDYDAALVHDSASAHARYGRGLALRGLGQTEEAERVMQEAIAQDASIATQYAGYDEQ